MHTCHAIKCNVRTKPEMFMCKRHWFMVPRDLRTLVWAHYRPGQCEDYQISKQYSQVAQESLRAVAKKEGIEVTGDEDELRLYKFFEPSGEGKDNG